MSPRELNEFLRNHNLVVEDALGCIEFVEDFLDYQIKKLQEEEPYATNTIARLKAAKHEVSCLSWTLEELV